MQTRREFLASTAAAAAVDAKPSGEWRNRQPGVAYRRLGRTGYMVCGMVMGGNTISPSNYEHVLLALDMGLNYLDTAPAYGRGASEQGYARVLGARKRDSFFLNSKVSLWDINRNKLFRDIFNSLPEGEQAKLKAEAAALIAGRRAADPDYIGNYFAGQRGELDDAALSNVMEKRYGRQIDRDKNYRKLILDSVDQSLRTLGTDHLDLLMCPHGANTGYELENFPEIFDAFEQLRKSGKVRHFGVSSHTDPAGVLDAAVKTRQYTAAMVAYNIVNHPYTADAIARAHKAGLGVIAMKAARPIHHGRNTGQPNDPARLKLIEDAVPGGSLKPPQKAYLWTLRNPNLSAVISELVNAQLVRENLPLASENKPA